MSGNYRQQAMKYKRKRKERAVMRIDYNRYDFSPVEYVRYLAEGMAVLSVFAYFFYRSVYAVLFLGPLLFFYMKEKRRSLCKKRKEELSVQFKDALNSVNSSLQAGYSLENAFSEAYRDMVEYHGIESVIASELFVVKNGIRNNQVLEDMVEDLGDRSGIDDICNFARILRIGKQSGGNLRALFENCMEVMEDKLTVNREIQIILSARRLESNVMCIIPFCIILYVDLTSRGYFDALYTTAAGRVIMTICLVVYLVGFYLLRRIMEIEV